MILGRYIFNLTRKTNVLFQIRSISCWSCGSDSNQISNLFCSNCKALQKPEKYENYFKVLGVKETYDLNEDELAKKYKELQKHLHPDKYANRLGEINVFKI